MGSHQGSAEMTLDRKALIRLALRPKDAAKALGIGERLLWSLTNRNEIPHFKLGSATLYSVDALRQWMAEQATKRGAKAL